MASSIDSISSSGRCSVTTTRRAASSWCCSPTRMAATSHHGRIAPLDPTPEPIAVQLEDELSRVKAQLRSVVEQYRGAGGGGAGLSRRAPGDERGAALLGGGDRDKQGGAPVSQRGTDHRQPGTEDQDRRAASQQQRFQEPDQLHRHRHAIPRSVAAPEDDHAPRAGHLQRAPHRRRPPALGHHQPARGRQARGRPASGARSPAAGRSRSANHRWPLVSDAHPALSNDRRPDRRHRPDVPGRHRATARRARSQAQRGADARHDRQRHRLRHRHHH